MKSEIEIKDIRVKDDRVHGLNVIVDNAWEIELKWDGCINLWGLDDNLEVDPHQYMHICDVTKFIDMLSQVEQFRLDNIDGAE